jgi:GNAT superfamily N-acetyltransferase
MGVEFRRAVVADAEVCGGIIYDAFKDIADRHGFPPTFSSIEVGTRVAKLFIGLPAIHSLIAESDGRTVGAIFLDEGDPIRGVAIVAVQPSFQRRGIGRALMEAALERARSAAGVRLVQEAYNAPSMGLYASLGFEVKEPLVRIVGRPRRMPRTGRASFSFPAGVIVPSRGCRPSMMKRSIGPRQSSVELSVRRWSTRVESSSPDTSTTRKAGGPGRTLAAWDTLESWTHVDGVVSIVSLPRWTAWSRWTWPQTTQRTWACSRSITISCSPLRSVMVSIHWRPSGQG